MTTANLMNVPSVKGNVPIQTDASKKLQEENLEVAEIFAGLMNQTIDIPDSVVDDTSSNMDVSKTNSTQSPIVSYERYNYKEKQIDTVKEPSVEEKLEESSEVLDEAGQEVIDTLCEEYGVDEETIQNLLITGWGNDPFFQKYVDQRNLALGDKNEFYSEDDSILSVMKVSGNHHDIIRQRLGAGSVQSISTYWCAVKVYAEFERVVTGAEEFAKFVTKMYDAYDRYVKNALYDAMVGYSTTLTGQFKHTGTVTAEKLNALCDLVSTATGNPVIIMGTRTALSKVTALQNATYISDAMKDEHYRTGTLGMWEGKELVEIPQVFEKGKVGE